MEPEKINDMFMGIMRALGRIEERQSLTPTRSDVFKAVEEHRLNCSRRSSITNGKSSAPLAKALIAALVALTGTVIALTQFLGN